MRSLVTCLICALLVVGCGKKDGGSSSDDKVASCATPESCREYRGGNLALGTKSLEELCTAVVSTAKFTMTACPPARVIGTCTKSEGKDFYYEGYPIAVGELEKSCKDLGGTFGK